MKKTPTQLNNRILSLDLLRGFALLGIFLANMLLFHTPFLYIHPFTFFTDKIDVETFKWIAIFVQSSFYPIFAFLFGYGINMQYEKSVERNDKFGQFMSRRLTILLLFGLSHALFLWSGDVLFTYAALGFTLIFFVKLSWKWLTLIAASLYVIPNGLLYFTIKFVEMMDPTAFSEGMNDVHLINKAIQIYGSGSIGEIFRFRFVEWLGYGLTSTLLGIFIVLPLILFGAAMSKWKLIERAPLLKNKLLIVGIITIPVGLFLKSLAFFSEPTFATIQIQQTFGGVILAGGYVVIILFFTGYDSFNTFFKPLRQVGRMSLTTYLCQSIIATTLFYSYGFGMYGKLDLLTGTFIAIGIFVLQVVFAEVWLAKYSMGPFERLWRTWTYKEKFQNKLKRDQ